MKIITNNYYNCPDENKRFRQRRIQEGEELSNEGYIQSYHNQGQAITEMNYYYCDQGDSQPQPQPTLEQVLASVGYQGEDQGFSFSFSSSYEGR